MRAIGKLEQMEDFILLDGRTIGTNVAQDKPTEISNVKTWVSAHNAANQIDAMGYDGDKAIEMLPRLIDHFEQANKATTEERARSHERAAIGIFMRAALKRKPHDPT